jgi:L-methionine (R)-S-oxide reductase
VSTVTTDTYRSALGAVDRIVNREAEPNKVLTKAVGVLAERIEHYSWIGVYLVEGSDLVLGPWRGRQATEHTRIPIGQGICGAAAASGRTEIVDDVNADDRYLACFVSTRSEIVVPISFDVDSDELSAFTEADCEFLERVALLLSPHAAGHR